MKGSTIALLLILLAVVGSIGYLESQKVRPTGGGEGAEAKDESIPDATEENPVLQELSEADLTRIRQKEGKYLRAPELTGLTGHINADSNIQIADFRGKVVLVDFWTYTCINCIRTLPYLTEWDSKYKEKGLVIIGVHTPEFEFEKVRENVVAAMAKHGIEYRVVQDNDYATWRAFGNRYWPRKYLIDQDGFIRYDHIGEGKYAQTEAMIQELLEEIGMDAREDLSDLPDNTPKLRQTPELYAGYSFALPRGQDVNAPGLRAEETQEYLLPDPHPEDTILLEGSWTSRADSLHAESEGRIVLDFQADAVNIVADAPNLEMDVEADGNYLTAEEAGDDILFDGERSYVVVSEPRLYNLYRSGYGRKELQLSVSEGFSFNAFTFG